MSRYSVNFDKLGERRVPESGNLIRRDPRPKDDCSSPILKIPPEIRLLIWQHLLDEIRFTFELKSADVPLDCRITISHYKLMSFLQTCRRFREEGLTVIKPTFTYLTSRSRSVCGVHGTFGHNASLRRVPLQLDDIHATVKHLDIDAEWAATICHAATSRPNPLSKVLNLKTIHVLHSTYRGYLRKLLEDENPRKLDCPKRQFSMIQDLLADGVLPAAPGAPWGTAGATALPLHNLGKILKHIFSQMKGVAITLEADIVSPECGISDDSRCFPISRQLEQSHVRLEIPSLRLTHLSANLYNKAIPFANIHSTLERTRTVALALEKYWSHITTTANAADPSMSLSTTFVQAEATRLAATDKRLGDLDRDLRDLLAHIHDHMPGPVYERLEIEWRQEYRGLDVKVFKVRDELVATHCFWKVNYALCAKSTTEIKE